jgi:beta-1,2-mannosidase
MRFSMKTKSQVALCNSHRNIIAATLFVVLIASSAYASLNAFELCSPKNGDDIEVSKPLLFWQSCEGASRYEVFIDDAKIGEVSALPIPVMSYAPITSLTDGSHYWHVKAVSAFQGELTTSNFVFNIHSSTNWPAWAIGPFVRYGKNPILRPQGTGWEGWNAYNPGVIYDNDHFLMLYRGQEKHGNTTKSRIGYAESQDGVTFTRNISPAINATEPYEQKYGCEDARISKLNGVYYTFYTGAYSNKISLCEATSTDAKTWSKLGVIQVGTKNGALICNPHGVPVKISGKFAMFTGDQRCGVCYSEDLTNWSPITWINLHLPKGWIRPWEPCVAVADYSKTDPNNIVLFIAGTLNGKGKWYYAISETLFSKDDLTIKIDQLNDCIFKPQEPYESGTFPNCVWMNSILLHDNQWWMHYGAGDRNIGLATAPYQ